MYVGVLRRHIAVGGAEIDRCSQVECTFMRLYRQSVQKLGLGSPIQRVKESSLHDHT